MNCKRSRSTVDRDHSRATEHQAYLTMLDYERVDWSSVNDDIILTTISELEDFVFEIDNEELCSEIEQLIETLRAS